MLNWNSHNSLPVPLRNVVPVVPALNGGVVEMTEGAGQWPYPPPCGDPSSVINVHTHLVRRGRTMVNLPNVENICDELLMQRTEGLGKVLLALKQRSGMSLGKIAKAAGYKSASSVQRYFSEDYDAPYLPPEIAERFVKAFVGKGRPAITATEIVSLAAYMPEGVVTGSLLSAEVAAAFVWYAAQRLGCETERDDPEVLKLAKALQALLKVTASQQGPMSPGLVDALFAGADIQSPS